MNPIPKGIGEPFRMLWITWRRWLVADAPQLAAAIAFNALLSLAPMLMLLLNVASRLLGSEAAKSQLVAAAVTLAGPAAAPIAAALVEMIQGARGGLWATALGVAIMAYFSSAVFLQIRSALNRIWGVSPATSLKGALYEQAVSVVLVPAAVTAVLLTIFANLLGSIAGPLFVDILPRGARVWSLLNATLSFGLLTALLAFVFRNGPSVALAWSDVWGAAALTAVLFTAGNFLIGFVIGRNLLVSLYGAAGALVVVLLWIFYGAQILLFGAQFTRVYAERHGSRSLAGAARPPAS